MEAIEARAVIKWLIKGKKEESPTKIHKRMVKVYGGSCPSLATVKRWATEFKRGRKSLEDGRPSTATTKKKH